MHFWRENAGELRITESTLFWQSRAYDQLLNLLHKNHKNIEEKISGFMPENRDDPLCPVKSFRKYLEHLNPENNFLWQSPLDKINLETMKIWYSKQHLGKNTLGNFMQDVSKECKLSKKYTNHSIRVTGATVLTRNAA